TEKVGPRSVDDSLPVRIALSARPRFACPFHIHLAYHNEETNPVYLVSTGIHCRYFEVSTCYPSCRKAVKILRHTHAESVTHEQWPFTQERHCHKSWESNRGSLSSPSMRPQTIVDCSVLFPET